MTIIIKETNYSLKLKAGVNGSVWELKKATPDGKIRQIVFLTFTLYSRLHGSRLFHR